MYHAISGTAVDEGHAAFRDAKRRRAFRDADDAVLNAIDHMKQNIAKDDFDLDSVALCCGMDRFQANRLFRKVTGVSPIKFLFALRMDMAKRLLAETDNSVTDICFDVGYNGLGTFISRFKAAVGLPPAEYRQRLRDTATNLPTLLDCMVLLGSSPMSGPRGHVVMPASFDGMVFLGVFDASLPEGVPQACTLATRDLEFAFPAPLPLGARIFAIALPWKDLDRAIDDPAQAWRASISCRAFVGDSSGHRLKLDQPNPFHPPILTSLPILMEKLVHSAPVVRPATTNHENASLGTRIHEHVG